LRDRWNTARIALKLEDIQVWLDKRKPGQSRFTTQRQEPDAVKILSGTFRDEETGVELTTGTPISLLIENVDQRSKDYGEIKEKFRPGHADYTYFAKYGIRDYRGGGRSSARETAARVAAGAIARKILTGVSIRGAMCRWVRTKLSAPTGTGTRSAIIPSGVRMQRQRRFGKITRWRAEGWVVLRRSAGDCGERRSTGSRSASLCQA